MDGRIDVHQHAITPAIARLLREANAPFVLPWSLTETWDVFEANGIARGMLSNPIPGGFFTGAAQAADLVSTADESIAALRDEHPDEFGFLAALPMPYVDESLAQLDYAYDVLGADGVVLIPQSGGDYLGCERYLPLFEELNRRSAVVLVHPMMLPGGQVTAPPVVLADFLLDTTRAAVNLMLTRTLDRFPRIRWILAHAGGFLPYAASRVRLLGARFFGVDAATFDDYLGRFWYDTALSAPSALPSLVAGVGVTQVLFGTDWSAAPAGVVSSCTQALDAELTDEARELVNRGNALRLFDRAGAPVVTGAPGPHPASSTS
ncbi:amidohydrolase family protein [Amycolatopsis balhimycina]|uniref:amidohydrolase family protein n=1 Tax=Amycolatopsis balhimycina TaxID=208443 RepID=UPI00036A31B9|nr:amidohydrolase family protein [Amycolatopsis balhimycina]